MSTRSNARRSKRIIYTTNGFIDAYGAWHPMPRRNDKKSSPRGTLMTKAMRVYRLGAR